ncbi:hypothetical protein AAD018_012090 [Aestuariibius insulae]|uniref:hypothetical protein n=1 Tax=Aestuariibius insulae TaxID=2058287 RepID=UPI00345E4EFD
MTRTNTRLSRILVQTAFSTTLVFSSSLAMFAQEYRTPSAAQVSKHIGEMAMSAETSGPREFEDRLYL